VRIDILAIGSRGDVQPYVALGMGLQKAGHQVRVVTLGGFEELVRSCGLDHFCIGSSPGEISSTAEGRDWVRQRASASGFLKGFVRVASSLIEAGIARYWQVCQDVEALAVSGMGLLIGVHLAERLGVPLIRTQLSPFVHTRYDWAGQKNLTTALKGDLTAFLHAAFRFVLWSKLRGKVNATRHSVLSLPPLPLISPFRPLEKQRLPLLDGYSPTVVPRPPDWGEWIHVTGFWTLDDPEEWSPPSDLADFLNSGPPPVFVGFGSTPFPEPERTVSMVTRALERAGKRGILLAGGSGLPTGRLAPEVMSIPFVPHAWLFSRVSAAVHHGGAGVTGAALRAGLPSVVVPVFADQPFWGDRVFQLGAGPRPIPAKHLSEDALASAVQATGNQTMRSRASEIGKRMQQENGVARAVEILEQYFKNR